MFHSTYAVFVSFTAIFLEMYFCWYFDTFSFFVQVFISLKKNLFKKKNKKKKKWKKKKQTKKTNIEHKPWNVGIFAMKYELLHCIHRIQFKSAHCICDYKGNHIYMAFLRTQIIDKCFVLIWYISTFLLILYLFCFFFLSLCHSQKHFFQKIIS